jgi:hypothetical protein
MHVQMHASQRKQFMAASGKDLFALEYSGIPPGQAWFDATTEPQVLYVVNVRHPFR